jgi:hypothetical protein
MPTTSCVSRRSQISPNFTSTTTSSQAKREAERIAFRWKSCPRAGASTDHPPIWQQGTVGAKPQPKRVVCARRCSELAMRWAPSWPAPNGCASTLDRVQQRATAARRSYGVRRLGWAEDQAVNDAIGRRTQGGQTRNRAFGSGLRSVHRARPTKAEMRCARAPRPEDRIFSPGVFCGGQLWGPRHRLEGCFGGSGRSWRCCRRVQNCLHRGPRAWPPRIWLTFLQAPLGG